MIGVDVTVRVSTAVELALEFSCNSRDDVHDIVSYPSFLCREEVGIAGDLLCDAVLAEAKCSVAGTEQLTHLMEGETLWSEVGEEVAVVVVLTELAAGGDVRHPGEGGEQVVRSDNTGLVLLPFVSFVNILATSFVTIFFVFIFNIWATSPSMYKSTDVENYRHYNNFPRHSVEC